MSVLVLGGYGAVGGRVVRLLRAQGWDIVVAGRDGTLADRVVDLADANSYRSALSGVRVVVNCSGREDPRLAEMAAARGIPFVDISASTAYVRALESIHGPVLMGVGIAPGLTGMLAREAFAGTPGPVDILIGLGAGEKHGVAATDWTYGLLGKSFVDPDGTKVRNFTRRTAFELPDRVGYRPASAVRADFADQHRLTATLGSDVRTYIRMDTGSATLGLRALTWMPALARLVPSRMPGGQRWVTMARATDGTRVWATGSEQSDATAVVAAWSVSGLLGERFDLAEPTWLHDITSIDEIAPALAEAGISVESDLADRFGPRPFA